MQSMPHLCFATSHVLPKNTKPCPEQQILSHLQGYDRTIGTRKQGSRFRNKYFIAERNAMELCTAPEVCQLYRVPPQGALDLRPKCHCRHNRGITGTLPWILLLRGCQGRPPEGWQPCQRISFLLNLKLFCPV